MVLYNLSLKGFIGLDSKKLKTSSKILKTMILINLFIILSYEKHGEPRNHVPEEGSESEEGYHKIPNFLFSFLKFSCFYEAFEENSKK